jgi:hypothetical protein
MLPWVYYHENTRFSLRFYTNKTLLFIKYEKNHALIVIRVTPAGSLSNFKESLFAGYKAEECHFYIIVHLIATFLFFSSCSFEQAKGYKIYKDSQKNLQLVKTFWI